MKEYKIETVLDLHKIFIVNRPHGGAAWWFRGQSNIAWRLLPKAGRDEFYLPEDRDLGRFNSWKNQAIGYSTDLPKNDWECLAVAQHYGLATRLLDWTYNPMVATFFAVNENYESDGAVFGYLPKLFIDENVLPLNTKCNGYGFIPRSVSIRILNQKSLFTVHGPVKSEVTIQDSPIVKGEKNIFKVIIPATLKVTIQKHLSDYGFTYDNFFPDLDGLSKKVNYETNDMVNFRNKRNKA